MSSKISILQNFSYYYYQASFWLDASLDKLAIRIVPRAAFKTIREQKRLYSKNCGDPYELFEIITPEGRWSYCPGMRLGSPGFPGGYEDLYGDAVICEDPNIQKPSSDVELLSSYDPRLHMSGDMINLHAKSWLYALEVVKLHGLNQENGRPTLSVTLQDDSQGKKYIIETYYYSSSDGDEATTRTVVDGVTFHVLETSYSDKDHHFTTYYDYTKVDGIVLLSEKNELEWDSQNRVKRELKVTYNHGDAKINQPVDEKVFDLDSLPWINGLRYVDKIEKKEYLYDNGKLIPAMKADVPVK